MIFWLLTKLLTTIIANKWLNCPFVLGVAQQSHSICNRIISKIKLVFLANIFNFTIFTNLYFWIHAMALNYRVIYQLLYQPNFAHNNNVWSLFWHINPWLYAGYILARFRMLDCESCRIRNSIRPEKTPVLEYSWPLVQLLVSGYDFQ